GILTIGVVTKPFHFEGQRRMRFAEAGIAELLEVVDTLLIIPNQNLFRVVNDQTTFSNAFDLADQVLYSVLSCISDLNVKEAHPRIKHLVRQGEGIAERGLVVNDPEQVLVW